MYRSFISILTILLLSACSLLNDVEQEPLISTNEERLPSYVSFQNEYRNKAGSSASGMSKNVNTAELDLHFYVRGMMQQLVGNMQYVSVKTAMAVTSFVFLDGSYENSDIVGKQLAESFVHEIHKHGIPVVDFKATDYIRITQNGDFLLSKDFLDLDGDLPVKYVLTGTLVKQPTGYLVNTRVIGLKSKAVVATAQGRLPVEIVNSLISNEASNRLVL